LNEKTKITLFFVATIDTVRTKGRDDAVAILTVKYLYKT